MGEIHRQRGFQFIDQATLKDEGVNVRHKAKTVEALLSDPTRLQELRAVQSKQYWVRALDQPKPRGAKSCVEQEWRSNLWLGQL